MSARLWLGLCVLVLLGLPTGVAGGVAGLLAMAKSRLRCGHIVEFFNGRVVGVDLSVWLYQVQHLLSSNQSLAHMTAIAGILVRRAQRLRGYGVTLLMVADCPKASPAKKAERARRRKSKMETAIASPCGDGDQIDETAEHIAVETGVSTESSTSTFAATDSSTASTTGASGPLDVHGAFQTIVLALLAAAGFACVIAPYEADHQLAFLCYVGIIHAVITTDSDLLVLGAPQLVLRLHADGACAVVALEDMSRPLAAPQPGYVDPLHWLCAVRASGGDTRGGALVSATLLLVACVAPSDFNHFAGVGIVRAIGLVMHYRDALAAALAAAPGDERGAVVRAFISTSPSAFVDAVHAAHKKHCKPAAPLSKEEIVAGMLRALIVFTRSLCVDLDQGVEQPLTGASALTEDEIAITGRACADPEKARELAMGLRVRTEDGDHPPASGVQLRDCVCPRGMLEPQLLTYDMLPAQLRPIFELDASFLAQSDALMADLSGPVVNWPSAITVEHLRLFFKCVGETAPHGLHGHATKNDLARGAVLWLAQHRTPLPSAGEQGYDDDAEDMAPAQLESQPRYGFQECLLRDPTGLSCFDLSVKLGRAVAVDAPGWRNVGALALPPLGSTGWHALDTWGAGKGPPTCSYDVITEYYAAHYPRGVVPPLAANAEHHVNVMCRPVKRALFRASLTAVKPRMSFFEPVFVEAMGCFVGWLHGDVPASQTTGQMYTLSLCVRCIATPTAIAAARGLAPAAESAEATGGLTLTMREILWVDCPCKQKWKCAHVGALLWVVQLWGVANVAAHVDRSSFSRAAYHTWWLGLDQRRVVAHERATSRASAAWTLDFDRIRLGDVRNADGSLRSGGLGTRRMLYSPDPDVAGQPPLRFEDCKPETRRRMLEAFADANYARAPDGASGRRVGMCSFQFTNERGGTYVRLSSAAERDRLFPPGTVMHGHAERAEARAAAARETGSESKAARRARRRAESSSSQQ